MAIPKKELVGRNARIENGIYLDDYLTALNEFSSVDETFGKHKEAIAAGKDAVASLVMGTLGRSEWENHLVALIMTAAKAGEWRAVFRDSFKHREGLDAVAEKNFGYVVEQNGETYLLPSAAYVSRCQAELDR